MRTHRPQPGAESRPGRCGGVIPEAGAGRPRPRAGSRPGTLAGVAAVALLAVAPPAGAQEGRTPRVSIDGFGTLGLIYSSERGADYVWNSTRPNGPGHSEAVSPAADSRLAGQVTFLATPRLTAVVQVVSEQDHEDAYTPKLEWANVSYAITPDFSLRAGRTALAAFLVSDHRKVSFANPWMRPPVEVYGLAPVFSSDGVDAIYRRGLGSWTGTLQASFGRTEVRFPAGDEGEAPEGAEEEEGAVAEAERLLSVNTTLQRGGLTGRVAVATGVLSVEAFDPLFDGFRSFGPEGEAIAERYAVSDRRFAFATVAVEYDPGPWFGMGELAWFDLNSAFGERMGGYVTTGVRLGRFTPYATYSRVGALSETSAEGLSTEGLPPEMAAVAAQLNAELNRILAGVPIQQDLAVGARWDYAPGMALKLQVDFVDVLGESLGTFANPQPGFERGGSARLVSLATAFVF